MGLWYFNRGGNLSALVVRREDLNKGYIKMAQLKFKGTPAQTVGELPKKGQNFNFSNLVKTDLSVVSSENYLGKKKVLNIFPSVDTGVCATSVRKFNEKAADLKNTAVLNISADLPFALGRFCGAEGIKNCDALSGFRSDFGKESGLSLKDTPLAGLYARSVIVLSEDNKVLYTELVPDITQEPNYDAALAALN
jgi:thioredoxin-dependent peroxiredoxin